MLGSGWGIKSEPGDEMSAVCSPYHLSAAFQHPDPSLDQTRRNDRCKNRGRLEKKYKIQNIWVPISQANCILLLFLPWFQCGPWLQWICSHITQFEIWDVTQSDMCYPHIWNHFLHSPQRSLCVSYSRPIPRALVTDFIAIKSLLSSWGIKLCGILK